VLHACLRCFTDQAVPTAKSCSTEARSPSLRPTGSFHRRPSFSPPPRCGANDALDPWPGWTAPPFPVKRSCNLSCIFRFRCSPANFTWAGAPLSQGVPRSCSFIRFASCFRRSLRLQVSSSIAHFVGVSLQKGPWTPPGFPAFRPLGWRILLDGIFPPPVVLCFRVGSPF